MVSNAEQPGAGGRARVLVVDDDAALAEMLTIVLRTEGFESRVCGCGDRALEAFRDFRPDVVLLDLMLPGRDGIDVCRDIRAESGVPIVMLTARTDTVDVVHGLESGADDYVVKPFSYDELAARLRALSRRAESVARRPDPRLIAGPISLDETSRTVTVNDRPVDLSPREFSLLESLLRHPGQALSRDQLLDQAWPFGVAVTPNAVDAYVHYLRTKLGSEGDRIETVRGVGYRLNSA
jgi:two-component system, OmpR family, response regulator MtrA